MSIIYIVILHQLPVNISQFHHLNGRICLVFKFLLGAHSNLNQLAHR